MANDVGLSLPVGEQGPADPVVRVILVATPMLRGLLDTASELVEGVAGQLRDMEASRTAVASGSSSRIAFM
jgi:hypothetical protein